MNLVETFLIEIYSEKEYTKKWTEEFPNSRFIKVKAKWNCYGHEYVKEDVFRVDEWREIKRKGYTLT